MDTPNNTQTAKNGKSDLNNCPSCNFDGPFQWAGTRHYRCLMCINCNYVGQLGNDPTMAKEMWNNAPTPPQPDWHIQNIVLYYQTLYGDPAWVDWMQIRFQHLFDKRYNQTEYQALKKVIGHTFRQNIRMELLPNCGPFDSIGDLQNYINQIDKYFLANAPITQAPTRVARLVAELALATSTLDPDELNQLTEQFLWCNPLDIAILCHSTSPLITEESKKQYIETDLWNTEPPPIPLPVAQYATLATNIRDTIIDNINPVPKP